MRHAIGWTVAAGLILATADVCATDGDLRALLREHIRDPQYSLDGKPEYIVTDPAFIEPVLDQALKYIKPATPLPPIELTRAKRSAVTYYRLGLHTSAGLKALEARIAARFATPRIKRSTTGGKSPREFIEIDYGWMTGSLDYHRRYGIEHDRKGANLEGWAPSTRVLAGLMADAARTYPTAEHIVLIIIFPRSRVGREMHINYIRRKFPDPGNGWVIVNSKTTNSSLPRYQVWIENDDFSPYRDGRYSFYANCASQLSAMRSPSVPAGTTLQRRQCLNYAE